MQEWNHATSRHLLIRKQDHRLFTAIWYRKQANRFSTSSSIKWRKEVAEQTEPSPLPGKMWTKPEANKNFPKIQVLLQNATHVRKIQKPYFAKKNLKSSFIGPTRYRVIRVDNTVAAVFSTMKDSMKKFFLKQKISVQNVLEVEFN